MKLRPSINEHFNHIKEYINNKEIGEKFNRYQLLNKSRDMFYSTDIYFTEINMDICLNYIIKVKILEPLIEEGINIFKVLRDVPKDLDYEIITKIVDKPSNFLLWFISDLDKRVKYERKNIDAN